ncbi:MAG: sigma-70 family RNA polymerase sigma factor [Bryobacterales bacterium]|nr:sigma-70 family RNA polymerase sigma factor [Bryobacterales bacterium]
MSLQPEEITTLLRRVQDGDGVAQTALVEAVYDELKVIAARYMRRENSGHTLQTTALVNEAYLKLIHVKSTTWQDRAHFFAVASQLMRRILVDHARKHLAGKRGGGVDMLPLNEAIVFSPDRAGPLVQLDDALTRLAASEPRTARVIELRFFGGLSIEETAEVLQISPRTVKREWGFGRAWLRSEMGLPAGEGDAGPE